MYKNNSGFCAKSKVSKYKKGLCLTEKLVGFNPLLFLYQTVTHLISKQGWGVHGSPHNEQEQNLQNNHRMTLDLNQIEYIIIEKESDFEPLLM